MYQFNEFKTRTALDEKLAEHIGNILAQGVAANGKASIAVSGGSTPKGLFEKLANMDLPWQNITVTLADERWVDFESSDSNTRLVHENLLQAKAKAATFFHIKQGDELTESVLAQLNQQAQAQVLPFDVLILGMGEDGHTASLFPCSAEIAQGFAEDAQPLLAVQPTTAPHQRISFSFAHLANAKNTILHICGDSKKAVLDQALANKNHLEMPIRAFLHSDKITTEIFWAE
ncbi:6-phosphogluconolactonase [Thalassotalea sp. LPB0316]|uniref:6-phosphogluconolactonase n=1 Tax=Thalassotalea sp. LPB0316 TaxID=2769490 RepID=UPI00186778E2|nr:6-phosphogluconolactonase [Thalassotalea sp. LPB0316]QOL24854.1 6-phosphogluconolactonase [Thalassotalea sp. LPB0316]